MNKWIPAVPVGAGYALSLGVWSALPESVTPNWHAIMPLPAHDAESMPRIVFALLLPTIALFVWGLLSAGTRISGRFFRDAVTRFDGTYVAMMTASVSLIVVLHALLVSTVVEWPAAVPRLLGALLGVGLIAAGNVMPRVRQNWIAGIRTAATMRDERLWLTTHRLYGMILMAHGVVVVLLAFTATRYAFIATVLSMVTAALLAQIFAKGKHAALRRV